MSDTAARTRPDTAREPTRFHQLHRGDDAAVRAELVAGLSSPAAWIAPKHFYDPLGSRLFEAITELPEYYPTRTEAAIFAEYGADIAKAAGAADTLVDLGAGNCAKAAYLLGPLAPRRYVAVDISTEFLREALDALSRRHPDVAMTGVGADFSSTLAFPSELSLDAPVFFYAGSSIGNFMPDDALALLRRIRAFGGGLVIGVDLVKPHAVLEAAYDDALGVTAAFNRNVLRNVNRLIGADFAVQRWRHVARFDAHASRIEMKLEADGEQRVRWRGGERRFADGERIHTENSYKYTPEAFEDLLQRAGFASVRCFTDPQRWFGVFVARAAADPGAG